ncbi:MAG: ribosome maturation factor RimP [Lachnospiraceae bacterium]|nr:ribosome maturation factor RimP [Lachnospiraceae bacterium]
MTKHEKYVRETEKLLPEIVEPLGISVYDVEFVKEGTSWYLRVYIEKEGGVTVNDCESVHRPLSDKLDEKDFIDEMYILEVSSLGLGRPLKKDKDFDRNLGKMIEVGLYKKQDGRKEFTGVLKAYDKDTLTLSEEDGEQVIERKNISRICEYVNWDE